MNYIFLNANNGVFYRKYPFDPGIQVWLGDVVEALATKIASYPPLLSPWPSQFNLCWVGYHADLNVRGDGARLVVTTQGYGMVYGPHVASDRETDNSGNGNEETNTEEADICYSTSLLQASVLANSLLLYYPNTVVPYSVSSLSIFWRAGPSSA